MHWDTGNIAFMLVSTSLVMLMTPGLAFFYGGLVGRKNVLTIMLQSFVSMGVTTVLWVVCGYSMAFSGSYGSAANPDIGGVIGNFHLAFFHGIDPTTPFPGSPTIPLIVFVAYQMMFAQITPALITGAFANRVTFKAYLLFLVAWLLLVYFPVAHMVWGGGILAAAWRARFRGRHRRSRHGGFRRARGRVLRREAPRGRRRAAQHSARRARNGAALVWLVRLQRRQRAESGFGHGAGVPQHRRRGVVCRDHLARARLDLSRRSRSSSGCSPARSPASPRSRRPRAMSRRRPRCSSAIAASVVCYYAISLKNKMQWDDALDVWGVHGVGGVVGVIALGLFAYKAVNPDGGADGLIHGDAAFFCQGDGDGHRGRALCVRVHVPDARRDSPHHAGDGHRRGRGVGTR